MGRRPTKKSYVFDENFEYVTDGLGTRTIWHNGSPMTLAAAKNYVAMNEKTKAGIWLKQKVDSFDNADWVDWDPEIVRKEQLAKNGFVEDDED